MAAARIRPGSLALSVLWALGSMGALSCLGPGCADEAAARALGARLGCPPGTLAIAEPAWFGLRRACRREDGRWHGPHETDWRSGAPRSRGSFAEGLEHGPWRRFTEKGELAEEGEYRAGERVGPWRQYVRGRLFAEGGFLGGQPAGPWRYFDEAGRVVAEGRLEPGETRGDQESQSLRQGEWTTWTAERQRCQGDYRDGQKSGRWICWHGPEGDPAPRWSEGEYLEGLEQGRWTSFHPNGRVQRTGEYRLGLRQGRWEELAPDGTPVGWTEYRDSVMLRGERYRP